MGFIGHTEGPSEDDFSCQCMCEQDKAPDRKGLDMMVAPEAAGQPPVPIVPVVEIIDFWEVPKKNFLLVLKCRWNQMY